MHCRRAKPALVGSCTHTVPTHYYITMFVVDVRKDVFCSRSGIEVLSSHLGNWWKQLLRYPSSSCEHRSCHSFKPLGMLHLITLKLISFNLSPILYFMVITALHMVAILLVLKQYYTTILENKICVQEQQWARTQITTLCTQPTHGLTWERCKFSACEHRGKVAGNTSAQAQNLHTWILVLSRGVIFPMGSWCSIDRRGPMCTFARPVSLHLTHNPGTWWFVCLLSI